MNTIKSIKVSFEHDRALAIVKYRKPEGCDGTVETVFSQKYADNSNCIVTTQDSLLAEVAVFAAKVGADFQENKELQMKQPIKKQWNLPFDLCRLGKTVGIMAAIIAIVGLFLMLVVCFPQYVLGLLFTAAIGLVLAIIGSIIYDAVGPCK